MFADEIDPARRAKNKRVCAPLFPELGKHSIFD
jgi:hypothetical protein